MKMLDYLRKCLEEKRMREDQEYKDAVHYGYDHFKGKELDDFLRHVNDLYENVKCKETKK